MSTELTGNIRQGWVVRVNGYTLGAVGWILYWIGWALSSVHEVMPVREAGATFGWKVPISVALLLISTAGISFIAGYSTREDNNHG